MLAIDIADRKHSSAHIVPLHSPHYHLEFDYRHEVFRNSELFMLSWSPSTIDITRPQSAGLMTIFHQQNGLKYAHLTCCHDNTNSLLLHSVIYDAFAMPSCGHSENAS